MRSSIAFLLVISFGLLSGCDDPKKHLTKDEIEQLCKKVGWKAYVETNANAVSRDGAEAECKLKYLAGEKIILSIPTW
jgi:hypothetical protein